MAFVASTQEQRPRKHSWYWCVNTLRPWQNGRHFADDIFKCIFLTENVWISINISLKFVPKGLINNIPALVQIMAWRRPGDKPLSEPMMVNLLTHICVTQPQWVNNGKITSLKYCCNFQGPMREMYWVVFYGICFGKIFRVKAKCLSENIILIKWNKMSCQFWSHQLVEKLLLSDC